MRVSRYRARCGCARALEDRLAAATPEGPLRYGSELRTLARRGSLRQRAITAVRIGPH